MTVDITGGFETVAVDNGRPVVLIAAALGVEPEVFRRAFSGVTPSQDGPPTAMEAQSNKAVLLAALGPYGIDNDQLDEVSNYYRYNNAAGESWPHRAAAAEATIIDGVVTAITVTDPGVGYTSTPTVVVPGHPEISPTVAISYTSEFNSNGSISSIQL